MSKDQSALLEELRTRHRVAQARLQEATQAFQESQQAQAAAQAAFQKAQQALSAAQQQMHGWTVALVTVEAEEVERRQASHASQVQPTTAPAPAEPAPSSIGTVEIAEPVGKTEIIRDLLRQHPQGMTPTEIWGQVRDRFKHRAYLYNVLKRLTDREELSVRRGKYSFRIAPPEVKLEEVTTVH
jgi:hypothetical protein